MKIPEIVSALGVYHDTFPREAVQAAIDKKDEIIPELMEILKYTIKNTDEHIDKEYWGHIYALYLLAQFRVEEAYPLVIELLELPEDRLDLLFGDFTGMDSVMASVSGGDPGLIRRLIENRDADEYIRCYALDALMTIYVADMISRDDLINYFQELFEGKLEKDPAPVWDHLVDCCANIQADDLQDLILDAFDSGLVWEGTISKKDVEEAFAGERQEALEKLKNDGKYNLINDVIEEMSWWACFNGESLDEDEFADQFLKNASKLISEEEVEQFRKRQEQYYTDPYYSEPVRTEPKIGRNQPCPCGSGEKYKKCCGKPGGQS